MNIQYLRFLTIFLSTIWLSVIGYLLQACYSHVGGMANTLIFHVCMRVYVVFTYVCMRVDVYIYGYRFVCM